MHALVVGLAWGMVAVGVFMLGLTFIENYFGRK